MEKLRRNSHRKTEAPSLAKDLAGKHADPNFQLAMKQANNPNNLTKAIFSHQIHQSNEGETYNNYFFFFFLLSLR